MYQQLPENKMAAEITISRHLYTNKNDINTNTLSKQNQLNTQTYKHANN